MAIDHVVDYPCEPKNRLTTEGLLDRLKKRERVQSIIQMYRQAGDERPPSEMGFEFSRSTPEGESEIELHVVQDVLDEVDILDRLDHHCRACPANRAGRPFGCASFIQYPITGQAEAWLLNQLPLPHEAPLVWLLLKQGMEQFAYDGETIRALRMNSIYFEDTAAALRGLGEFTLTANQAFEMLFGVGNINPNHAAMLLLFFGAIQRNLEADEIMTISPALPGVERHRPFLHAITDEDDRTTAEFKDFLLALYDAWRLNVLLIVDP